MKPAAMIESTKNPSVDTPLRYHPWSSQTAVSIVLMFSSFTVAEVQQSISSILGNSYQNFRVEIISDEMTENGQIEDLKQWLKDDRRFSFDRKYRPDFKNYAYTLICRGGILFSQYSIEALIEVVSQQNIVVVRSLLSGSDGTVEFWSNDFVSTQHVDGQKRDLEQIARRFGAERWVSSNAIGLYTTETSQPKQYFRKGAAGQFEYTIVVFDAQSKEHFEQTKKSITRLEYENRQLRQQLISGNHSQYFRAKRVLRTISGGIMKFVKNAK